MKKNLSSQRGISLMEILTAMLGISVLISIILSNFSMYVKRSKARELDSVAYNARMHINDYYRMNGSLPADNPNDIELLPTDSVQFTESVTWEGETLTIVADAAAIGLEEGRNLTIRYEPSMDRGLVSWTCIATGETQFAPKGCN